MEETSPKKKFNLGATIGGIVGFAIAYFLVQQFVFKKPGYEDMMVRAAAELNKSCPVMVDNETRLDSVTAVPKANVIRYLYTLVNFDKAGIDVAVLEENIRPSIIENVKVNPDMKYQRDHQTAFVYSYSDKNGEFLFRIDVTPDMYK